MFKREIDFDSDVAAAVEALRRGGLIIYPTDTVWGIGCDARQSEAVARIFALKRRDDSKALISLVDSAEMLAQFVDDVPEAALEAVETADRPLTVIYDRARGLARNLAAADGSVGIRLTRHTFSAALCRTLGAPVVSTSVNRSGEPAARDFSDISSEILGSVDYVAVTERDKKVVTPPSRVVKIDADGKISVLRP